MQGQNEDFTPVGFDTLGAPGPGAEKMIKWLAGLFEDKYQFHKSQAVAYVRQRVSVVVHRCCLMMHTQVAERAAAKRQQKTKGRVPRLSLTQMISISCAATTCELVAFTLTRDFLLS